ncbi:class I SAM-dependent methyltransferase [Amycolatopsis sp.]|uniref:class I SAM-dependent methyltransferase n=1 Tax=Amycolatopsis sp. TaxID=37632 RepID=UPI002B6D5713|nr:methyltransferase domain-containing protein [Amycolatopsis sp.]HVV07772.1 methyltransferase domain-containing protein [Amycolatopsis sp.]
MEQQRPVVGPAELFDAIGSGYEDAFGRPPVVARAVGELLALLPPSARVLDIGSGTGRPVAHALAGAGCRVTGLDVSGVMISIAREQVPDAEFVHTDVRAWTSPPACWDAVCAYFPFLQMPRADTEAVLANVARWLVPGGYLSLITVPMDAEELPVDFLGHPVRITSFPALELEERVTAAGLRVVSTYSEIFEPDGGQAEEHLLITARRP